ncbi:MAG: GNAT family N-acetyltransferase [Christensenellaceae bacterium]|nr:GNAT family N-acetyltransferase [Christensenellaceae bacterium]
MKHLGTVRLETERLILRRCRIEDAEASYKNWTSDEKVTKFLTWPTHSDVNVTKMILTDWANSYEKPDYYQWLIELKEISEPIGSIAAVKVDDDLKKVEIGYCIGSKWWHRGIMTEAFSAVIGFFFREVGMNRIEARHDINNPHSGAVMKKCGLQLEGTHRQADRNNQGIVDVCVYGILAADYFRK